MSAQVVTANGRTVTASADENADLFWALRGGGGNFGGVTEFEFGLHEVSPMANLGQFFWLPASAEEHSALIAPLRELAPQFELVMPIPHVGLQQMFDESGPWGILAYERALYLDDLSDPVIDLMIEQVPRKASPMTFVPIFALGGAYGSMADHETAFGGDRTTRWAFNIAWRGELRAAGRDQGNLGSRQPLPPQRHHPPSDPRTCRPVIRSPALLIPASDRPARPRHVRPSPSPIWVRHCVPK